jgi:formylmethanofuran dehydrogenase subunit C
VRSRHFGPDWFGQWDAAQGKIERGGNNFSMTHDIPIDAQNLADSDIRKKLDDAIRQLEQRGAAGTAAGETVPGVHLRGTAGRNSLLMDLGRDVQLTVDGPLGAYAFAFNRTTNVRIEGSVGDGVGEGMISGSVRVRGDAGIGAGTALQGGTLAIYGRAGDFCGAAMRGGELFVRGDVGAGAGAGALWGTIVIGGDTGEGLGDRMRGSTIFLRGKVASLGRGVREAPLREREKLRLGLLLINAGIRGEVKDFRRIVSEISLRGEDAKRPKSELNPSWR